MWTALWHTLVYSVAGALLAAALGAAGLLMRHFVEADEASSTATAIVGLLALGSTAAGLAGGLCSLTYQRRLRRLRDRLTLAEKPPDRTPQPRRPLRRHSPLAARISERFRWDALSPNLVRLLHRPVRELQGRPLIEVLHPDDRAVLEQALQRARATGQPQALTCRFLVPLSAPSSTYARTTFRSDTELLAPLDPAAIKHLRLHIRARPAKSGIAACFHCRFSNWTARVRLQQTLKRTTREGEQHRRQLRRVRAEFRRLKDSYFELYHHAPVMYFRLDVDGRLIAFNDTLLRTLGYRRDELAGHSYAELLEPVRGGNGVLPRGQAPFESGEVETRWRTKDGTVLDIWVRTVADLDEDSRFVRYRSAALDLTEKNRLANELRARRDELEATNDRLRAINTELEDFTYVVSHDLKEPLRTLQTYGHLLAEEYSVQLGPTAFSTSTT